MRAALIVNRVGPDSSQNLADVLRLAAQAADRGAELLLFPEAALTGLINDDDPVHDLPLGRPIPGPVTVLLGNLARARRVWLAIGLLERDGDRLYDSALLLSPQGTVALQYRRIQPQWHGCGADPSVYGQGTDLAGTETPWGTVLFLICGDLFDDGIVARARSLQPRWLLFPFARGAAGGGRDQQRWDRDEMPSYLEQVRRVGAAALMVNYLAGDDLPDDASFGGAWAVHAHGSIAASLPLGRAGMLLVDLAD